MVEWNRFNETSLSEKEDAYSQVSMGDIADSN